MKTPTSADFDTKARRRKDTKFFLKTKMLMNGKWVQPFERIEPLKPLKRLKPLEP